MGFSSKHTAVGGHSLLQGIFPTQRSNPSLLHRQAGSLRSEPPGEDVQMRPQRFQGLRNLRLLSALRSQSCSRCETAATCPVPPEARPPVLGNYYQREQATHTPASL
ncbi:unnamed protein product [Rangifer tarandus platyrhynchus]|uniref:Uncharacterized protein n=2 Tax=Rangifer tarandus platyrhynchus TaxID=3082113 RepID=A0ABN8YTI7_RANTA|nr:unnamed protein product [Rangifer tarandus platyrhynchus]